MLRSAIQQKAFPGASVAITYCGKLIGLKGVGHFTYKPDSTAVTGETIYDLASVSKAVATTTACMLLYEQGKFHLEQKLVEVLPEFGGEDARREQVTFRMLLAHSSGLPAYVKLFQSAKDKQKLLRQAYVVPLAANPGSHAEYSDVGFILLGEALERIAGEALDHFCGRNIFEPLGLAFMAFNPPQQWRSLIPPTEDDRSFRHKIIQGEVNDENAWVMGGVAGHAGCFGRAVEVAVF
ncbi:MAG TPA: serine hydrolase domain-containing protein, partial [Candidatus Angelobacter sp.]|nr:serine hydrolase domain-containing protein [Candidatus Angelobacter sp.]